MSEDFELIITEEFKVIVPEERVGNVNVLVTLESDGNGPASFAFKRGGLEDKYDYTAEFQIRRRETPPGPYTVVNHLKWRMKADIRIQNVDYEIPSSCINGVDRLKADRAYYSLWAKITSGSGTIWSNNTRIQAIII